MAQTAYLHIGLPKAGSTFVQTTMWVNRATLRERGFLYPGQARMDHYRAYQDVKHRPDEVLTGQAPAWRRLLRQMAGWDGDALLSHEFFSRLDAPRAKAAVAGLRDTEVQVVLLVRANHLQYPAAWQQALKMKYDLSFDDFMESALSRSEPGPWDALDVPRVVGTWLEAVPPERLTVITVPPPTAPRGLLWQRWRETVGIDDDGFDLEISRANESMGAAQAALLHRLKPELTEELLDGASRHRWVRGYFSHRVLVRQQGERFGPRPDQGERLREQAQADAAWLVDQGVEVVGDLAELHGPAPQTAAHPDDVSNEEMLQVALVAIEQMLRDMQRISGQRNKLRAELDELTRPAGSAEQAGSGLTVPAPALGERDSVRGRWQRAARRMTTS